MMFGLFFLSVGLLALGASLPRTSGQKVTGDTPRPPTNHGFPLPTEKLFLELPCTFLCMVEGLDANETEVIWLRKGEPAAVTIRSTSDPAHDELVIINGFRVRLDDWTRGPTYDCVVQTETDDEDTGNPSASHQTLFRPRFQEEEADSEVSMSCMVKGPRPPGVSIVWYENFGPLPEDGFVVHDSSEEDPLFIYSTLTFLRSTALLGNVYSCAIGQEGLLIQPTQKAGEKTQAEE